MRPLTLTTSPASLFDVRRLGVAVVGIVAFLALSGSAPVAPLNLAFTKARPEPLEGESYYYDAMWSGVSAVSPLAPVAPADVVAPLAPAPTPFGFTTPATLTSSGIPEPAYRAYVNAATELSGTDPACRISWSVIAGIGRVESNHGRFGGSSIQPDGQVTPPILGIRLDGSRAGTARISDSDGGKYDGDPVYDRAVGPMQFLPGTWKVYGGGADPQNMNAAALATGRYLCAGNSAMDTQAGRWAAVYRYNHSDSYVSLVLSLADSYAAGRVVTFPTRPNGTPAPNDAAPGATAPGPPPSLPPVPPVATTAPGDPTGFPVTLGPTRPSLPGRATQTGAGTPSGAGSPSSGTTPSGTSSGSPTGVPSDQDPPTSGTTQPATGPSADPPPKTPTDDPTTGSPTTGPPTTGPADPTAGPPVAAERTTEPAVGASTASGPSTTPATAQVKSPTTDPTTP